MLYLLMFLLRGKLPWQHEANMTKREFFEMTRAKKSMLTPFDLCQGKAEFLLPAVLHAYKLKFSEEPNYSYIKKTLI